MAGILKTSREIFGNVQMMLARSLDDMLGALPDSAERDRTIRKYLSKHAPCCVEDYYWSLVNVLDYDFAGYDVQHFTLFLTLTPTLTPIPIPASVPIPVPSLALTPTSSPAPTRSPMLASLLSPILTSISIPSPPHSPTPTHAHTHTPAHTPPLYTPNLHLLRNLCLAAKLAYEDPPVIKYITNQWKMKTDDAFFLEYQDTQAYIMYDDSNIVLCFRGTEFLNPRDWQTDVRMHMLDVVPRKHVVSEGVAKYSNKPMAHSGFIEALGLHNHLAHDYVYGKNEDAFSQIHHVLSLLQMNTGRRLWITGHSLGAALASIFTAQLLIEGDAMVMGEGFGGVYTYGQPRTGNAAYCDLFADLERKGKVVRVVNQRDIVTHIPLVTVGYAHHGNKVFIDKKCNIIYTSFLYDQLPADFDRRDKKNQSKSTIAYSKGRKTRKGDSPLQATVFALLPQSMEDHYPCDYIRHLERSMDL